MDRRQQKSQTAWKPFAGFILFGLVALFLFYNHAESGACALSLVAGMFLEETARLLRSQYYEGTRTVDVLGSERSTRYMDPGTCTFCGEPTNNLAGNPGRWSLQFTHPDGSGLVRDHHVQCVQDRLFGSSPDAKSKYPTTAQLGAILFRYIDRLNDPVPEDPIDTIVEEMLFDANTLIVSGVDPKSVQSTEGVKT